MSEGVVLPEPDNEASPGGSLAERRRWFAYFPHGTIEFIMVTHALTLLLAVVLPVVRATQRPAALAALGCMLLADYLLMLWWVIQLRGDADLLSDPAGSPPAAQERRRRIRQLFLLALPGTLALAAMVAYQRELVAAAWGLLGCFAIAMPVVARMGGGALSGTGWARWGLLVPLAHIPAVHRIAVEAERRLRRPVESGAPAREDAPLLPLLAGILWVLTMLPWAVVAARALMGAAWPESIPGLLLPIAGVFSAMPLAVVDIAVLEHAQRVLLRRLAGERAAG